MNASVLTAACLRLLFVIMLTGHARCASRAEEAIVVLKAANASAVFFCAAYLPAIKSLPKNEEEVEYHPFVNALNETECDYERRGFEGKVVLLERCGNTTNDQLIEQAKSAKAAAIIVSIEAKRVDAETRTNIKKLDIVVAFVSNVTARKIAKYEEKHNESGLAAKLIATTSSFDCSFFAIWIIAMGTVMTGSFWSGVAQKAAYAPKSPPKPQNKASRASRVKQKTEAEDEANPTSSTSLVPAGDKNSDFSETIGEIEEEFSMPLSPKLVIMFVIHMSVMLLTLYYFYRYLIYLIIIMFSLASASALFACLEPIVNRIGVGTSKVPEQLARCCADPMEIRHVALAAFALGLAVTWYCFRNNEVFGWALQDILAIAFCVNMLKSIHLPNLRMICLLLSLLLVYDVFFVFITPFLQANRESVMVEVAKGGNLKEALPVVVRFPKLVKGKFQVCVASKFSILGLGDILAPGLLLSYCHAFDLLSLGRRFYFYITCAAYGVGMVVTFVALHLMRNAQPALLYLVPCTILPTVLAAWYRGELFHIWNGLRLPSAAASSEAEAASEAPKPAPSNHKSPDNSEIELNLPGNGNAPQEQRKRRGNLKPRSASQDPPKSAVRGGPGIETVVAEGDINGATTCDAFFLHVAERLMMPSPSALPPYSIKPTQAGGEKADAVIEDVRRSSAAYKWEGAVVNGHCVSLGGIKTGDVDILPESSALFPA